MQLVETDHMICFNQSHALFGTRLRYVVAPYWRVESLSMSHKGVVGRRGAGRDVAAARDRVGGKGQGPWGAGAFAFGAEGGQEGESVVVARHSLAPSCGGQVMIIVGR